MEIVAFPLKAGAFPVIRRGILFTVKALLALALITYLSACGSKPPPTEIEIKPAAQGATIDLIAVASPLINPGPDGVPSPVVMRIYQLNGETNFANGSFRQLWEEDEKTLGTTMLAKTEIYLTPGGVQRIKANLIEGTTIVAVVVGYRSFEDAKWRAMVGLQGDKRFKLKADLKTAAVELGPQD